MILIFKIFKEMEAFTHYTGLHPDTLILLSTGGEKLSKDIQVGDSLIGYNSTVRKVIHTYSGEDNMFQIVPKKGNPFICNSSHMLTLKGGRPFLAMRMDRISQYVIHYTQQGDPKSRAFKTEEEATVFRSSLPIDDMFDMRLNDFLQKSKTFKKQTYIFHQGVNFASHEVPFDPYMIGYWLGDGSSAAAAITTVDVKVIDYFNLKLPEYGLQLNTDTTKITYCISSSGENFRKKRKNIMLNTLKDFNMLNNKHIPDIYKINSFDVRLKILAGLIDSDGHNAKNCIEIIQKNIKLSDDIVYLAFSLGFMVTRVECQKSCMYLGKMREGTYQRMCIFGEGLEHIPTILERKKFRPRENNKRVTCQSFTAVPLGKGLVNGLILEGDGRFLLNDFTIMKTHSVTAFES